MHCPKCGSLQFIEYFPAFTEQMKSELRTQGFSEIEIKHFVEQWEDQQIATGGFCPDCQYEWLGQDWNLSTSKSA